MVKLLVSRGALNPSPTTSGEFVTVAAIRGHVAVASYLLQLKAVKAIAYVDARGGTSGTTPIWKAAEHGHWEMVKL